MSNSVNDTVSLSANTGTKNTSKIQDYSEILSKYGIEYSVVDYYLQVGNILQVQGWVLHLSVIRVQLLALLEIIMKLLIKEKTSFRIVKSQEIAKLLLDGNLGYAHLGKVICIYPETENQAAYLAEKLIELTKYFVGPDVLTDFHIGSVVYTRYEGFNPIKINQENGSTANFVYNNKNELIPDCFTVPFLLPQGVNWPFSHIVSYEVPKQRKLLNNIYKPLHILKPDAKGNVLKGLYIKRPFNIKSCLIKEGKRHMWADDKERDIRDRLNWQSELHKDLYGIVPLPKILDLFEENKNTYLVMEFIKGVPFDKIITSKYAGNNWANVSYVNKQKLINFLLKIILIVDRMHEKGYVHRDLTPVNILINKKDQIFFIDLELCYSINLGRPSPPFKLGTPGFMSPEQLTIETPTVKEDIYGLGSLLILIFTGLPPIKFNVEDKNKLQSALYFLTGSPSLSELISTSLASEPEMRPSLKQMKAVLETYIEEIKEKTNATKEIGRIINKSVDKYKNLIDLAIQGLSSSLMLTEEKIWSSGINQQDRLFGNQQLGVTYQGGLYSGMTGVMYMLGKAKQVGFNVDSCKEAYRNSANYLHEYYFTKLPNLSPGLYTGAAGLALMSSIGLETGLLSRNSGYEEYIQTSLEIQNHEIDLATGLAGQGIALLQCSRWINQHTTDKLLRQYIDVLINAQGMDGSWNTLDRRESKNGIVYGLANGVSGILCFLIAYCHLRKDDRVIHSIRKGLNWLTNQSFKTGKYISWHITTKVKEVDLWSVHNGVPGIILCFIKAYEFFQDQTYKEIAEKGLYAFPSCPTLMNYTSAYGLAGFGDVLLETFSVFKDEEWKIRADWIAELFYHTHLSIDENSGYWAMDASNKPVSDLLLGNSGIIYFLIRHSFQNSLNFQLL